MTSISAQQAAASRGPRAHAFPILSGFSALVYGLLWLKELGLLFGNTAHAAAGAFAAGFILPPWIGFTGAYLLAMAINMAIGTWAFRMASATGAARPAAVARTTADDGRVRRGSGSSRAVRAC